MTIINFDYDKLAETFLEKLGRKNISKTLEQFCTEVLGYMKRNRSKKTYEGAKLVCDKLMKYFAPLRNIDTIYQKDCEDWLDFEKQSAKKAYRNYFRVARALFNKALSWNLINENPFNKLKLEKIQKVSRAYVTEEILWKVVEFITIAIIRDVVIFAYFTGMRLGEVVNLLWECVNLKDNVLVIGNRNQNTKNRKQRYVPMHPKVREILLKKIESKKYKVKSEPTPSVPLHGGEKPNKGYVFCKKNGYPFTTDYFSKKFKKACRAAGIDEEIHFHSIRHGAITAMVTNGANLTAVQQIAGHSSLNITMLYNHPEIEDLKKAIEKL